MYPNNLCGEGNGTPLQYSCLENPMDGGAWQAAVPGVAKSRTRLNDFTFTFHFHALEKEMATQLQCSCLENPRDGGAWWAAVYGVTQSQTRLKRLSSSSSSSNDLCLFFNNLIYQIICMFLQSSLHRLQSIFWIKLRNLRTSLSPQYTCLFQPIHEFYFPLGMWGERCFIKILYVDK